MGDRINHEEVLYAISPISDWYGLNDELDPNSGKDVRKVLTDIVADLMKTVEENNRYNKTLRDIVKNQEHAFGEAAEDMSVVYRMACSALKEIPKKSSEEISAAREAMMNKAKELVDRNRYSGGVIFNAIDEDTDINFKNP